MGLGVLSGLEVSAMSRCFVALLMGSVMAEGQCGNIFCSRSQVCCRTGNGATHICGAPGSTCCRTRNGAGDRLRSSSEVLQQLQRPRRSNVQQMSSVVCFSRRVLLYRQRIAARCRLALVFYKVPSMGWRSACKSLPQVCPPSVFLGRCSLYRQRSAAMFHWFLSRGLKTVEARCACR